MWNWGRWRHLLRPAAAAAAAAARAPLGRWAGGCDAISARSATAPPPAAIDLIRIELQVKLTMRNYNWPVIVEG